MKTKTNTSKTILVPFETWAFLRRRMSVERSGRTLDDEAVARMWRRCHKVNGDRVQLDKNSLGGVNASGKWYEWSVEEMVAMIEAEGLPFEPGDEIEYIEVYL